MCEFVEPFSVLFYDIKARSRIANFAVATFVAFLISDANFLISSSRNNNNNNKIIEQLPRLGKFAKMEFQGFWLKAAKQIGEMFSGQTATDRSKVCNIIITLKDNEYGKNNNKNGNKGELVALSSERGESAINGSMPHCRRTKQPKSPTT